MQAALFRITTLLFIFLITVFPGYGQTKKQWAKHGDKSFSERDFYGASLYYREALMIDTTDTELIYKYAESLRHYNEYGLAEKYYAYLFRLDKGVQYPEALFWLGTMQKHNAKYLKAKESFSKYASNAADRESYYYRKALQEVNSCAFAIGLLKDTLPVSVENLGHPVNTENSEFSPLMTDSVLYFSSLRAEKITELNEVRDQEYFVNIFTAERQSDQWNVTGELDSVISETGLHIANGSFSPADKRFYFSVCDSAFRCRIYSSEKIKGIWQKPEALPETINKSGSTSTQPMAAIAEGRPVLFFTSDREGGLGKLDIWYSVKEANGWSEAINAGKNINTLDDDICPYYDHTRKVLYFSSSWHYGLGGFDVFKSTGSLLSLGNPENLGIPFNSSANDFYFSFYSPVDSTKGFLTSNRKGAITKKGETCCNDIWQWETIAPVEDQLAADRYKNLIQINRTLPALYFHNDEPGPRSLDTTVSVPYHETWASYMALKNEYLKENELETEIAEVFFKEKVETGMKDLDTFCTRLSEELQKGRKLRLYLKGHASPLSKNAYNLNLSKRRISSFIQYLNRFGNGKLSPHLADSSLIIVQSPLGENEAAPDVSDDLNRKKESVYSIKASLERKVTVQRVELISDTLLYADLCLADSVYDFGEITEDSDVDAEFRFVNRGNRELIIQEIKTSCGCLVASFPKAPIRPGEEAMIKVKFRSSNRKGPQNKAITILSNAEGSPHVVYIKGVVK